MGYTNEKIKIGLCQTGACRDKRKSLESASNAVAEAARQGANMVVLSELFGYPYTTETLQHYAETIPKDASMTTPGQMIHTLAALARTYKLWLVGGSIPELENTRIFQTSVVFNPEGKIVARHRKIHLFDMDVAAIGCRPPMKFKESAVFTAGEDITLVDLPWCRMGIGVCHDIRFPEMARAMRERGAKILVYTGAFNMATLAQRMVLARGRAADTQSYVVLASPVSDQPDLCGHSAVVGPWANVVSEADTSPGVWIAEVDPAEVDRVRRDITLQKP